MLTEKVIFTEEECKYLISIAGDNYKPLKYFKQPEVQIKLDQYTSNFLLSRFADFKISAMPNKIKILKYSEGVHFNLHIDSDGKDGRIRTVITQLSNGDSYSGGDLEIINNSDFYKVSRQIGNSVIFSPSSPHKVSKIEKGLRYIMVFWLKAEHLNFSKSII